MTLPREGVVPALFVVDWDVFCLPLGKSFGPTAHWHFIDWNGDRDVWVIDLQAELEGKQGIIVCLRAGFQFSEDLVRVHSGNTFKVLFHFVVLQYLFVFLTFCNSLETSSCIHRPPLHDLFGWLHDHIYSTTGHSQGVMLAVAFGVSTTIK